MHFVDVEIILLPIFDISNQKINICEKFISLPSFDYVMYNSKIKFFQTLKMIQVILDLMNHQMVNSRLYLIWASMTIGPVTFYERE